MTPSPLVPHWTDIDWRPSIADHVINGLQLHYLDYGTGPAVVLLRGMASSWQWWLENVPALAQQHRVIAVDLPAFGESEPLPAPTEMTIHARTVLDLLTQIGIESATVAGYSMGGLVAIEMFNTDPGRVRNLTPVDSGGVPMSERRLPVILAVLRLCAAVLRRSSLRRAPATKTWGRGIALRPAFRDPRAMSPELAAQTMPIFGGPGSVDAIPAAARTVHATVPESISCPVLLMWGEHDVIVPPSSAYQMHDKLPDSQLAVLAGAGHSPMIQFPDRFNDSVLTFLAARCTDYTAVRPGVDAGTQSSGS